MQNYAPKRSMVHLASDGTTLSHHLICKVHDSPSHSRQPRRTAARPISAGRSESDPCRQARSHEGRERPLAHRCRDPRALPRRPRPAQAREYGDGESSEQSGAVGSAGAGARDSGLVVSSPLEIAERDRDHYRADAATVRTVALQLVQSSREARRGLLAAMEQQEEAFIQLLTPGSPDELTLSRGKET